MSFVTIKANGHEYNIHKKLKENFDKLKKANARDWDFKIIISGNGMTRTGKTTFAAQLAKYLNPNTEERNWIYRGDQLIKTAMSLGKGAVIVYDEAREGLDSKKAMHKYSQNIVDYFNECGYLNQYLMIILPDFFDLNKSIALNLSISLINVGIKGNFHRGYFDFYSRKAKRYLFIKGKKFNDYNAQKPTFDGTFTEYFPFEYQVLEDMKKQAIRDRQKQEMKKPDKSQSAVWKLSREHLWNQTQIANLFDVSQRTISNWIQRYETFSS